MTKTIEEVISERGYYVTNPKGMSMFPMLREGTGEAYIVKPELPLRRLDVPVYKRRDGTYVMHRVLSVDETGYSCCGDNQWVLEKGVSDSQIIGVLDSWYKNGKKHTVRDKSYLRYARFWSSSLRFRRVLLAFAHGWRRLRYFVRSAGGKILRILKLKR